MGDFEKADKYLTAAEEINPASEDVYFYRGVLYDAMGDNEKAMGSYRRSLELDYCQAEAHYNLGVCCYFAHLYDEALRELKLGWSMGEGYEDTFFWIGRVYIKQKEYRQALDIFMDLNRQNPEDPDYMKELSYCSHKLEDYVTAYTWIEEYLKRRPDDEGARKMAKITKKRMEIASREE